MESNLGDIQKNGYQELVVVIENPHSVIQIDSLVENVIRLGADFVYVVNNPKALSNNRESSYLGQTQLKTSVPDSKLSSMKKFNSTHECFQDLSDNEFVSIATVLDVDHKDILHLDEVNYSSIPKLAIWFKDGNEGISEQVYDKCQYIVTIPTVSFVEVINIATLISQVLREVSRQRSDIL